MSATSRKSSKDVFIERFENDAKFLQARLEVLRSDLELYQRANPKAHDSIDLQKANNDLINKYNELVGSYNKLKATFDNPESRGLIQHQLEGLTNSFNTTIDRMFTMETNKDKRSAASKLFKGGTNKQLMKILGDVQATSLRSIEQKENLASLTFGEIKVKTAPKPR
jgi:hypothetical protein